MKGLLIFFGGGAILACGTIASMGSNDFTAMGLIGIVVVAALFWLFVLR